MIIDNKEEFLLFLILVQQNKNLGIFTTLEYNYSDIVDTIEKCERMGYIKNYKSTYTITPLGEKKIIELQRNKNRVIILPRSDKKKEKLGLFDIYVPVKKWDTLEVEKYLRIMSHYSKKEYSLRAIPGKFHQVLRNLMKFTRYTLSNCWECVAIL